MEPSDIANLAAWSFLGYCIVSFPTAISSWGGKKYSKKCCLGRMSNFPLLGGDDKNLGKALPVDGGHSGTVLNFFELQMHFPVIWTP